MIDLKFRVIWQSADLNGMQLGADEAVVVVDVLRATSTICAALAGGWEAVMPCADCDEARAMAAKHHAALGGERGGLPLPGFELGNSPRYWREAAESRRRAVLTTTNGTRAFSAVDGRADCVVAGSFLNLQALASWLRQRGGPVSVVCAGTDDHFSLEDALFAGALADLLEVEHAVRSLWRAWGGDVVATLGTVPHGRRLVQLGLADDVVYCGTANTAPVVPILDDEGWMVRG